MEQLGISSLYSLLQNQDGPCVTMYLECRGPASFSLRFGAQRDELLEEVKSQLQSGGFDVNIDEYIKPLKTAAALHIASRTAASLVLFRSRTCAGFFPIKSRVHPLAIVANSFHLKPR